MQFCRNRQQSQYTGYVGKWAEGRTLSKKCWALLRENKYFLWFPILGLFLALIPIVLFGIVALSIFAAGYEFVSYIIAFFGLVFINYAFTISAAALVSAADEELAGRDASIGYGFRKAFGKLVPLFTWSIIRAIVSMLFSLIRGNGEGATSIVRNLIAAAGAAAWSVITFFVTPYIMFHDTGAIAAIKASALLVKEKWGTQLTGGIRIGASLALIFIPAILMIVVSVLLLSGSGGGAPLWAGLLGLGVILFLIGMLISSTLKAIFSVALFRFALDGSDLGPFTTKELEGVLHAKA